MQIKPIPLPKSNVKWHVLKESNYPDPYTDVILLAKNNSSYFMTTAFLADPKVFMDEKDHIFSDPIAWVSLDDWYIDAKTLRLSADRNWKLWL